MNAESFGRLKLLADRVTGQHLFSEKTYLYASRLAKLVQTSGFQDVDQFVMAVTNQSHVGHELKLVSALLDTGTRFFEDRQQLANMIAFLATQSACEPVPEPLGIWCAGVIPVCADEDSSAHPAHKRRRAVALALRCVDRFRSMQLGIKLCLQSCTP